MKRVFEVCLQIKYNDACVTQEERILYDIEIDLIWRLIHDISSRYDIVNASLVNYSTVIKASFLTQGEAANFEEEICAHLKKHNCTYIARNRAYKV